jgi:hypothetical protein
VQLIQGIYKKYKMNLPFQQYMSKTGIDAAITRDVARYMADCRAILRFLGRAMAGWYKNPEGIHIFAWKCFSITASY